MCVGEVVELTSGYYYNTRTLVMRDRPDINLVSLLRVSQVQVSSTSTPFCSRFGWEVTFPDIGVGFLGVFEGPDDKT